MALPPELEPDADWSDAKPEVVPQPTIWPSLFAFGITFTIWGLLTSMVLIAVGLAVLVASLVGWIGDLRHEEGRT